MADLLSTSTNESASNNTLAAPDGAPEGMAPSGVNDTIREQMAATKRFADRLSGTLTTGGTANAQTANYSVAHAAYYTGERLLIKPGAANTGPMTINVNTLGAKTTVDAFGNALVGGELTTTAYTEIMYDGTNFRILEKSKLIQRQRAEVATVGASTTVIPFDDTIPLATEGVAVVSVSLTPKNPNSTIRIRAGGFFTHAKVAGDYGCFSLCRDTSANAIAATAVQFISDGALAQAYLETTTTAIAATSTTFTFRTGPDNGSDTVKWNAIQSGSTRRFGGAGAVFIEAEEFQP